MKKYFKLLIASAIAVSTFIFAFTIANTYAAELDENTEPDTTEVIEQEPEQTTDESTTTLTDDEKNKINDLIDFIQSLNEDELFKLLDQAKTWLITGGIVTIVTVVTLGISLLAAVMKLRNEKIRNSQLTEQAKQEKLQDSENLEKQINDKFADMQKLLLSFMDGLTDEEKEIVKNNTTDIRAKLLETMNKTE